MEKHLDDYMYPNRVKGPHLSLIETGIPGGRISKQLIDSIRQHPAAKEISISGLTQETFDYFIRTYGGQFEAIIFWKCPLVEDLKIIESLAGIRRIVYFWNERATRLWDFSKTKALQGLAYDDFTRLHDIPDIAKAPSLAEFRFGDRVWPKNVVNSLSPLQGCSTMRRLSMWPKKIVDDRIEPIASLANLESLDFPYNLLTTEQVAWLKAHLQAAVKSRCLNAYGQKDHPIAMSGKNKDTFIVGKGKPFLDSKQDKSRIDRYVYQFDSMYRWYLANPQAKPEDYRK